MDNGIQNDPLHARLRCQELHLVRADRSGHGIGDPEHSDMLRLTLPEERVDVFLGRLRLVAERSYDRGPADALCRALYGVDIGFFHKMNDDGNAVRGGACLQDLAQGMVDRAGGRRAGSLVNE
jgi:hypothetical protein